MSDGDMNLFDDGLDDPYHHSDTDAHPDHDDHHHDHQHSFSPDPDAHPHFEGKHPPADDGISYIHYVEEDTHPEESTPYSPSHHHHHHDHQLSAVTTPEQKRSSLATLLDVALNSLRSMVQSPLAVLSSRFFHAVPSVQRFARELSQSSVLSSPWYGDDAKLGYSAVVGLAGLGAVGAVATGTVLKDAPNWLKRTVHAVTSLPMMERILLPDLIATSGQEARLLGHDHDECGHEGHNHPGGDVPDFAMNAGTAALWLAGILGNNSKFMFSSSLLTGLFAGSGALEEEVMSRSEALEAIKANIPRETTVLINGKAETRVTTDLKTGDIVQVIAGQNIPADARVIKVDGHGMVNTRIHNGEEQDAAMAAGSHVLQGSLVKEGVYTVELTSTPQQSRLQSLIERIEEAPQANLDDSFNRWTDRYVLFGLMPAAAIQFAHAIATGKGVGKAIELTLELFVKGAPCPLGAAPLVRKATTGKLVAEENIYTNDHARAEQLPKTTRVYFDIVGTLTGDELQLSGHPIAYGLDGQPKNFAPVMLERIAMAETLVNHPNARAVVAYAKEQMPNFAYDIIRHNNTDSRTDSRGTSGIFDGRTVAIGQWDYVSSQAGKNTPPDELRAHFEAMEAAHQKPVLMYDSEQGWAIAGFEYALREAAKPTVDALASMGIEVGIITGSDQAFADHVAKTLGIDPSLVHARATAEGKSHILDDASRQKGVVPAFVGDAGNDISAFQNHPSFAIDNGRSEVKALATVSTPMLESIPPLLRLFKNLNNQSRLLYAGAATWMTGLLATHLFHDMDTGVAAVAHESPTLALTAFSAGIQPDRNLKQFRTELDALRSGEWDQVIAGSAKPPSQPKLAL